MKEEINVKEVQAKDEPKFDDAIFFDDELLKEKKRILEEKYFDEFGDRIKILSNEPYVEDLLKIYYNEDDDYIYELPKVGEIVNGDIIGETSKYVLVDAGYKDYIYIEKKGKELNALMSANLLEGHEVDVMIKSVQEKNYFVIGSIDLILQRKASELLEEGIYEDRIFMGRVKELTAAGYIVILDVDGFESEVFMPKTLAGINKLPDPESIVGKTFEVMIENKTNEGYIVSRKKFLKTLIKDKVEELEYNKKYSGNITGNTDFGIFVEFNECLTGMIHKANIDKEQIPNINDVKPGQYIEFYVKELIKERGRPEKIILTQVQTESLWDTIEVGNVLTGIVKSNKQFGTLIQLDEGTVGLIHISELEKFDKTVLEEDSEVKVKVIAIQRGDRKIFLSLEK
jgi:ribosomal protein S1